MAPFKSVRDSFVPFIQIFSNHVDDFDEQMITDMCKQVLDKAKAQFKVKARHDLYGDTPQWRLVMSQQEQNSTHCETQRQCAPIRKP